MQNQFTTKNQSVDKAFSIIEYMSSMRMPLKLLEIAKGTGFPASTVSRLLTSLTDRGYVYQNKETLKYSLTLKFCRIGDSAKSGLNIAEVVHPYLIDISNKLGETAYFAIEQDMMLVYMDAVGGSNISNAGIQRIGKIAPLHCAGIGKLMLLNYDYKKLKKFIETKGLERFTPNTLCTEEDLRDELNKVKKEGYAVDDQECDEGIRCVAVPVRDYTGGIAGGISVSGPADHITPESYDDYLNVLFPVSKKISERLGFE